VPEAFTAEAEDVKSSEAGDDPNHDPDEETSSKSKVRIPPYFLAC
jgi:hypothetical protein